MSIQQDAVIRTVEKLADTFQQIAAADDQGARAMLGRIDRALADAFRARPETLHLQMDQGIDGVDERVAAEVGRLLLVRAELADSVDDLELARRSRRLAFEALYSGAGVSFHNPDGVEADASPLDRLRELLRDPEVRALIPAEQQARAWERIFEIERDRQHFPAAEDALFCSLRLTPDPGDVLRAGIRFYEELLNLPDEVLERRDLPRQEVREGLAELRGMADE